MMKNQQPIEEFAKTYSSMPERTPSECPPVLADSKVVAKTASSGEAEESELFGGVFGRR